MISKKINFIGIVLLLTLISLVCVSNVNAQEVIIDNGAPGTSYTGTWQVSSATNPYGSNSLWSRSGTTYSWHADLSQSGKYEVYMWWTEYSSRSTSAPVDITYYGSTERININQQTNGGKWNLLGTYAFDKAVGGTVKITAVNGYPTSYCADAVRFVYVPDANVAPVATIESITPNPAAPEAIISFSGSGQDLDGTITGYNWRSNVDGDLNTSASFSTSTLSAGTHKIYLKVQDNSGAWSEEVFQVVTIGDAPSEIIIDNGDSGTSSTGTWAVSGATNPYGVNSVWSRAGATYTWHADLSKTGTYEVYMWWTQYSSRSTSAPITITYSGGSQTINVNQQINGGKWNLVGVYSFDISTGATVRINAVNPSPTSYCADAVRLIYVEGGNLSPMAQIGSITPNPAQQGESITFTGSGTDTDGTIAGYNWRSSSDGNLSTQAGFSTSSLSTGTHTIYFKVQDNDGTWSSEVSQTLSVEMVVVNQPPTASIDSISPNPAQIGDTVTFSGSGTDSDGTVVAYSWSSNLDGNLSTSATFDTTTLSEGTHTIYFKVQDDDGEWSNETSQALEVSNQTAALEHIFVCFAYAPSNQKNAVIYVLQRLGAYLDGDVWRYHNNNQNKDYIIHFVEDIDMLKQALKTEGAHVCVIGHSNYGLGAVFATDTEWAKQTINNLYYIDDDRIFNYSSKWIHVSVRGMRTGQAYPYWWPIFKDKTSGIMPYDFNDSRGNPPYNYYITYQVPGDPIHYSIETVRNSAVQRFFGSGRPAWYSPDGLEPNPSNPDHLQYYITNTTEWLPSLEIIGNWQEALRLSGYYNENYHISSVGQGENQFKWIFSLPNPGNYKILAWWPATSTNSTAAPFTINHSAGSTRVNVSQRTNGNRWNDLGGYSFNAGENTVVLSNQTSSGNVVADTIRIAHENNPPYVIQSDFRASVMYGTAPLTVTFWNQSTGEYTSRTWNFGDGGTNSTRDEIDHTYQSAGIYTVSLTVSGSGLTSSRTKVGYITVGSSTPLLKAEFSASGATGPVPLQVSFRNRSSGSNIVSREWDFGDGTTSTSTNPSYQYTTPGNYMVSLTVRDSNGNISTETKPNCVRAVIFEKTIDNVDYPKTHFGSKTVLFRKDPEITKEELKYSRMFYMSCNSGNYYLDTFHRGIMFYSLNTATEAAITYYLKAYLEGKSDREVWVALQNYEPVYDYYDFTKPPSQQ
ncbi:MAG: PKD domain-containing protein [Candidatus Omnitrophica bacterium]|nr:PKD domain-containing protein [Candidatus Omnitrophota bacterium]